MTQKNVLIIYYSLTNQTKQVVEKIKSILETKGIQVDMSRLEFEDETLYTVPYNLRRFFHDGFRNYAGILIKHPLKKPNLNMTKKYDLVIFGYQSWFNTPSVPTISFFDLAESKILEGQKVISIKTCRRFWRRPLRIFKKLVAQKGGEVIDHYVLPENNISPINIFTLGVALFIGEKVKNKFLRKFYEAYGIGEKGFKRLELIGENIAKKILE